MESLARSNDLSILDTNLLCHIFLQELEAGKVGRESGPQIPGTKVWYEVELSITNPGIDSPKTLGILKKNGTGIANGHIGLIGIRTFVPIHGDHFVDLLFEIFSIGVSFVRCLSGGDQFFQVLFHIFHGGRRRDAAPGRDIRDQRPRSRMGDVNQNVVILEPFLSFKASAINRIFNPLIENMVDTLKPRIW